MAGSTSGDRPLGSTNEGQQEGSAPAPGELEDDQTLADREQTLADADQTGSDRDQTAAESDQAAADRDQAASDQDLVGGGDLDEHDVTRDIRDRSAKQRRRTADTRIEVAVDRDNVADARDLAAAARDQVAAQIDSELEARDAAPVDDGRAVTSAEIVLGAAEDRKRAATDRTAAAEARARAAGDREQAARDREQAARDREQAQADREAQLAQLAIAETDALTGTRTRAAGLAELDGEIDRARRTTGLLAVAYVDVVGLKAVNDAHGHAAGDALLLHAARAIRAHMRSYDLIVRLGGDEFLCVMSGTTIEDARQRFAAISTALAVDPDRGEIKVGFAALGPEDSAATLIERADAELPTSQRR